MIIGPDATDTSPSTKAWAENHVKKIGKSVNEATFVGPKHIDNNAVLKDLSAVGRFVYLKFTKPAPKSAFFSAKKTKLEYTYLKISRGMGRERMHDTIDRNEKDLMKLKFPNGMKLAVRDCFGASIEKIDEEQAIDEQTRLKTCCFAGDDFNQSVVCQKAKSKMEANLDGKFLDVLEDGEIFVGATNIAISECLSKFYINPNETNLAIVENFDDELLTKIVSFFRTFYITWLECHRYKSKPGGKYEAERNSKEPTGQPPIPECAIVFLDANGDPSRGPKEIYNVDGFRKQCRMCEGDVVVVRSVGYCSACQVVGQANQA